MTHLVLVERDPKARAVQQARLEAEGYVVTNVADGVEALRLLRERPWPQVVLIGRLAPSMRLEALLYEASTAPDLHQHVFVMLGCKRRDLPENVRTGDVEGPMVFAADCPDGGCSDPYERCELLATLDEATRCAAAI